MVTPGDQPFAFHLAQRAPKVAGIDVPKGEPKEYATHNDADRTDGRAAPVLARRWALPLKIAARHRSVT